MPSVYYLKNSLQLDLKICMDSACRRVETVFREVTSFITRQVLRMSPSLTRKAL